MRMYKMGLAGLMIVCLWVMKQLALASDRDSLVLNHHVHLPLNPSNYYPHTISRYMNTTNSAILYNEGKSQSLQSGLIILNFGAPRYNDLTYGTLLYDYQTFASVTNINLAVRNFIHGLWDGASNNPSSVYFTIAIGTSNCGNGSGPNQCNPGTNVTGSHGQAWALMVNDLAEYIQAIGYASKITVAGAIDIEADWNSVENTRNWIQGYSSIASRRYYNFGTCDGCPNTGTPSCAANGGTINNNWTLEDIFYVSYGNAFAYPTPEIYKTNHYNAQQWHRVSLYGYLCHNSTKIYFKGVLTQWQACQDTVPDSCEQIQTDNKPDDAWWQLWNLVYSDARTRIDDIPWKTDLTWQN